MTAEGGEQRTNREIFTYRPPTAIYGLDWSWRRDKPFRLAYSTFNESTSNIVQVIQLEDQQKLVDVAKADLQYPATKVMWMPYQGTDKNDLFATTGDSLRIFEMRGNRAYTRSILNSQTPGSEHHAPLTSFDWNITDPNIIGTSSVDTTCTIWDVQNERAVAQLIAHDKEVFDMAFTTGVDVFATVGADGSVRLFDLRNLEHSTIIYESPKYTPLLRVDWSQVEPNYLATLIYDQNTVVILDIRQPSVPLIQLVGHQKATNSVDWAPNSPHYIATGSEDKSTYIWDIRQTVKEITDPYLAYNATDPINVVSWSSLQQSWIAVSMDRCLQILRI